VSGSDTPEDRPAVRVLFGDLRPGETRVNNGNGRWSRMLTNVWLLERQQTVVEWPKDLGETSPIRKEYIDALKAADHGDLEPFIALHRRFIPMPARPVF
jgi:hypothetical protein